MKKSSGPEDPPRGGQLALVATPIGHLGDITARAVECLRHADRILAEDTRRSRALLTHLGITGKRVERLDAHVERRRLERWLVLLEAGERFALVSDAGTPVIADPGGALVRAAAAAGVDVTPVPGPSAVMAALAASGLVAGGFRFFGFLPRSGGARKRALDRIAHTEECAVLFESPRRLAATLAELAARQPARSAVVAREMTKTHEQFQRGSLHGIATALDSHPTRGEITLVLGPALDESKAVSMDDTEIDRRLSARLDEGIHPKQAAKEMARETGMTTRELYARAVRLRHPE